MGKGKVSISSVRKGYKNLQKNPDNVDRHMAAIDKHATNTASHGGKAYLAMKSGDYRGAAKHAGSAVKSASRTFGSAQGLYNLSKTKKSNKVMNARTQPANVATPSSQVSSASTANTSASASGYY
jgi:hypothetical protein